MMKRNILSYLLLLASQAYFLFSTAQVADKDGVKRIIESLASDDMRGRAALSKDIERAADFIADEFKSVGLQSYTEENYRQTFYMTKVNSLEQQIIINGTTLKNEDFVMISSV